ncbi:MAG: DUF362 domain-containing protein, partial [Candidatus Cloacimonetes bacterium]|nr:DUF362 domain-containing protein [Candidatus Cloacimonadota bacterium]
MTKDVFFYELPPASSLAERKKALHTVLDHFDFSGIFSKRDKVAVKTHFGDENNTTHIAPELVKIVNDKIKESGGFPFLTETSTLYSGPRHNAISHMSLAYKHGFTYENTGAPLIMADGLLGNNEITVAIKGELYDQVNIARDAVLADALVLLSHPTGHIVAGFGAALKNLGMGLSSRKGKLQQHSTIKPFIDPDKCTFCGLCLRWCPENIIIENQGKAYIQDGACVGCGECLTVCKFGAVKFNWGVQSKDIQKRIAEYALGAVANKLEKAVYINVLTDMTKECDCMNIKQRPIIPDLGILLAFDPVAIDQATLDLTRQYNGEDLGRLS